MHQFVSNCRLNELGIASNEMRRLRDETIRGVGALDKERLQLWDLERYTRTLLFNMFTCV